MAVLSLFVILAFAITAVPACSSCEGEEEPSVYPRVMRRMQPEAQNATGQPRAPLHWGQINFLHTSDSHGWLEGHIKERNYGADWGDFVSFTKHMKDKADEKKVDLVLIDTGDLHDGNGLSDATSPNGEVTNPIFENIDYDILTPGNHELIAVDVAYETFTKFAAHYGDSYLTSNLDICKNCQDGEPEQKEWVSMGKRFRYFTTKQGIRIMSFGVILDGTNNNKQMTRIQKAADMIKEDWFQDAIKRDDIDLFVLIGHNPVKPDIPRAESSFPLIMDTIRKARPSIPVQGFGGHTHRRDFHIYDPKSSAMESGKYCDTVGWLSLDDIKPKSVQSSVTSPKSKAPLSDRADLAHDTATDSCQKTKQFDMQLTRRYLDWNRLTFAYHAKGSQNSLSKFNTASGLGVTKSITDSRNDLNLTYVYGCAPRSYCISCKPVDDPGNIYTLVKTAAAATVVNEDRANNSRMIIVNNGAIRYDLVKGPFTVDDSYIVCPYRTPFKYLADVPYAQASQVLDAIIAAKNAKSKRAMTLDTISSEMLGYDECDNASPYNATQLLKPKSLFRRILDSTPSPGYTTCDDLGDDGDDTVHSVIPEIQQPPYVQATAGFPETGQPETVDLVFSDFLAGNIVQALNSQNQTKTYDTSDAELYLPETFTSNDFLPKYAQMAWQENIKDCPVE